jgi:hypothetical protein
MPKGKTEIVIHIVKGRLSIDTSLRVSMLEIASAIVWRVSQYYKGDVNLTAKSLRLRASTVKLFLKWRRFFARERRLKKTRDPIRFDVVK